MTKTQTLLELIKEESRRRGYTFETVQTDNGVEERMIRPDGSVALIARKSIPSGLSKKKK